MTRYATLFHASVATVDQVNASPQPPSRPNGHTGTGAGRSVSGRPHRRAADDGALQLPPFPTPPNYNKCNPEDVEAQLDSQQVAGLAPGATELFYMAYNPLICFNRRTANYVKNNKDGSCPKGADSTIR